jgi:probable phosphoglycerate mutase
MRCVETVTLLNKPFSLPVEMDVRLQEQDWGIWTGKTHPEIQRLDAQLPGSEAAKGWEFQPPKGEIRRGVLERALEALASAAARWPGQHILVVSHEGVIRCLVYHLTGRKFLMSEQKLLKPYRMHHIALGSKGFHVLSLNAVSLEPMECRGSGA